LILFIFLSTSLNAQTTNDYRSRATGNWSTAGSWERYNGSSWATATVAPSSSVGTITILNSHTITVTANVTADQLVINSGGILIINSSRILTIANEVGTDLTVNGTVSNAGTITQSLSTAEFNSGSKFIHNQNGGAIIVATWNSGSNLEISGLTGGGSSYPSNMDQSFFNVLFNSDLNSAVSMNSNLTCNGNLTLSNIGTGALRFATNNSYTATITGNLIHTSGEFRQSMNAVTGNITVGGNFSKTTGGLYIITFGTGNSTLTVNGNVTVDGGTLDLTQSSGTGNLFVKGNFSHSGGTITETNVGIGNIFFNGTAAQIFTYTAGTVSGTINYTVDNGAILEMSDASTKVYGNGFTLSSGGTLNVKSADGITKYVSATADSSKGNIRTLNRSYSTSASYIYSESAQTLGNGLAGALNITLSGSDQKTFSNTSDINISGRLLIGSGTKAIIGNGLIFTAAALTLAGTPTTASAFYGGQSAPFDAPNYNTYTISTTKYPAVQSSTYFGTTTTGMLKLGTPAALPVTLSNFTAKQTTDNKVALAWVTSSESVNKGFSIERQEEGSGKFQSLGFIASKAVGGNSQATLAYSFKDATAKNGTNMYRLVQEDLDGKKTYSEVRVVKLSAKSVSNVFPNPSTGAINISRSNDGKKMNIQVIDQSGRIISQVNNITDANYRMNLAQSGIYSIKMMYPETGEQSIQRVVVQK